MKRHSSQEKYPPIWVWAAALVIAAFCVIVLFGKIQRVEYEFTEFEKFNEARVNALLETDVDLKVIVIGDSRIRYSIDSALFEAEVEKQMGQSAAIITITANRGVWNNVRQTVAPLLGNTSHAVLVIDDNMFAKEWTWLFDFKHKRDFAIWSIFGRGNWRRDGGVEVQEETQSDTRCEGWLFTEETPDARARRVSEYFRINPSGEAAENVEEFAKAVSANGVRVAALYVPPRPGAEPMVWKRPTDPLTLHVEFDPDPGLYCDPVHLNSRGREVFTRSFVRSFADWFVK